MNKETKEGTVMSKFKVGDRVICKCTPDCNERGIVAQVIMPCLTNWPLTVLVEFDTGSAFARPEGSLRRLVPNGTAKLKRYEAALRHISEGLPECCVDAADSNLLPGHLIRIARDALKGTK